MKTVIEYIQDILDYLNRIERFTVSGKEDFFQDERTQFAVIRAYEVIGEIIKRLPEEVLQSQPQVNWQTLRRFRDFLAHNYDMVDLDSLWAAVQDLPNLRNAVLQIQDELPKPD